MDIQKCLEATVSNDKAELDAAQRFLEEAAQKNLPEFLLALANILADSSSSQVAFMAAGLQLKNAIHSKEETSLVGLQQRWLMIDNQLRAQIKMLVLRSLGRAKPSSASQCVAAIACAEIPNSQWVEVIDILLAESIKEGASDFLKEATLEAIGYICQDIDPRHLVAYSDKILTAIVSGMHKAQPNPNIRLAATTALLNSLDFTRANFEKDHERHYIMEVVCEGTQAADPRIRVAALQNLVKIVNLYYEFMELYMSQALFSITLDAMRSQDDDVVKQGIEFWSTVCEEEIDIADETEELYENDKQPLRLSKQYSRGALPHIVPLLLQILVTQEEGDDEDDWSPSKAAVVCLTFFATACGDDVVQYVLPFVMGNISHEAWQQRDAAVMAFGSILEGPDPNQLGIIVLQALPVLIRMTKDPSVVVRDSVSWALGRICEQTPNAVYDQTVLASLVPCLLEGLQAEPRIAANICWALTSLATNLGDEESSVQTLSCLLSSHYPLIMEHLLATTERPDANKNNLRIAAYEAVRDLVKNAPKDCYSIVLSTFRIIIERVVLVLGIEVVSANDQSQYHDLQSLLCATLQSALPKVTESDVLVVADNLVAALLQMLRSSRSGGVQEDIFFTVGAFISAVGSHFAKYLEVFVPFLIAGLGCVAEKMVCIAAVSVTGDLFRALGKKMLVMSDQIMSILMENLASAMVHRDVKPNILTCFSDVALAIEGDFHKYAEFILQGVSQASLVALEKPDADLADYINELREGCLVAYTGVVQGYGKGTPAAAAMIEQHIRVMMQLMEVTSQDADVTDDLICHCCGLIGDLLSLYNKQMLPLVSPPWVASLLTRGRKSKRSRVKTVANWATAEIRKMRA